jgi:ACT domain-containing protein
MLLRLINIECKLPDSPGSLIELIKPISNNSGNIYGILHYHDKKINNMIPVSINFELPKELMEQSLEKIQIELEEKGIEIVNITLGVEQRNLIVILSGHVFDTDVVDTIKRLASKNIKVSELQAKFTDVSEISNVKLKIKYPESMTEKIIIRELQEICKEKGLTLLR